MADKINVSIIIPTYNDSVRLKNALESIKKITYSHELFEVVIVDDGSIDNTNSCVSSFVGNADFYVRYIHQENKGPAAARNNGVRSARGKYILFIDSDCSVDKDIIGFYLKHFPDDKLAGVGGNVVPDIHNPISEYLDYIDVWRPGRDSGEVKYLVTANAFFLKNAIVDAGYFNEAFRFPGGEEPELCRRIIKNGYTFKYDADAVVKHAHRCDLKGLRRMYHNYGRGSVIEAKLAEVEVRPVLNLIKSLIGRESLIFFKKNIKALRVKKAITYAFYDYIRLTSYYYGSLLGFLEYKQH